MRKKASAGSNSTRSSPKFAAKEGRTAKGGQPPTSQAAIETLINVSDFVSGFGRAMWKQLSLLSYHRFSFQIALLLCACGVAAVLWLAANYADKQVLQWYSSYDAPLFNNSHISPLLELRQHRGSSNLSASFLPFDSSAVVFGDDVFKLVLTGEAVKGQEGCISLNLTLSSMAVLAGQASVQYKEILLGLPIQVAQPVILSMKLQELFLISKPGSVIAALHSQLGDCRDRNGVRSFVPREPQTVDYDEQLFFLFPGRNASRAAPPASAVPEPVSESAPSVPTTPPEGNPSTDMLRVVQLASPKNLRIAVHLSPRAREVLQSPESSLLVSLNHKQHDVTRQARAQSAEAARDAPWVLEVELVDVQAGVHDVRVQLRQGGSEVASSAMKAVRL